MLIAVDGTESRSWMNAEGSNSHVHRFFNDYHGNPGAKLYHPGPSNIQGLFSVDGIVNRGLEVIEQYHNGDDPIDLVGHSRGALAVIRVAMKLKSVKPKLTVRFMGLYDAVDRCLWGTGEDLVPENVLLVAHARRDKKGGSRTSFGNCGIRGGQRYIQKFFLGTHSGIGGDAWNGDRPKGMTANDDKKAAASADNFIRNWAAQVGVSLS